MCNFEKYLYAVSVIMAICLGSYFRESLAGKRDTVGSRLWNICISKVPTVVKLGAESAIALYAGYIAFGWVVQSLPDAQQLYDWKKPLKPVFQRLLYNGCIIVGLGHVICLSGNACLNDLERL